MEGKTIRSEEEKDGRTRYFDDNHHTLGYSKPDQYGRIIFYDESGIPTGDYAEIRTPNETWVYDSYGVLKAIRQTYGNESTFYDKNYIETGRSISYVGGITEYTPTKSQGTGGIYSDEHIIGPGPEETLRADYWDNHIREGRVVRFSHLNLFQWAALILFAVSLFCSGITPAVLLYIIIGLLIFVAIKLLDSMAFASAFNYHPRSISAGFEIVTIIGLAAAVYLRPRLNSFLYGNHYNNRLSLIFLSLSIIPVAASLVYKVIDRKKKK
ncbi:MAG: hypothetical protein J5744_04805 [Oscillospiraceae bacterium]|nr:hypothetical protein [Oscillospiraceae bacterium]